MLTYRQIPPLNTFLLLNCPMKIKAGQAQSNWFAVKEPTASKRVVRRSPHPRYE